VIETDSEFISTFTAFLLSRTHDVVANHALAEFTKPAWESAGDGGFAATIVPANRPKKLKYLTGLVLRRER
jgi:hypothetical protein